MIIDVDRFGEFELGADITSKFATRAVPWGFGALSWAVFQRSYSRDQESWWQTCRRMVQGMMTVLRVHCQQHGRPWEPARAQALASAAFERLWDFRWTPPGRGLWIMGTRFMYERGGAALNNCGFVSTADVGTDYAAPFAWMLRSAMLGVGVGFDTRGQHQARIVPPAQGSDVYRIGDDREGWAAALARLLDAYVGKASLPQAWDYTAIRPAGTALRGFGGHASGALPLRELLESLTALYASYAGKQVDATLIVDTMNLIGRCVVAGGVRRSAQIAFGEPSDRAFRELKLDREKVAAYRWASNNSVFAHPGMDYEELARLSAINGEPGYLWLDTARAFGRLADPPDHADAMAMGSNPCVEQTLWDRELCCLVETYPAHHDSYEDFERTLEIAYLYAKSVTLVPTGDATTDRVMQRNRRMGCSMTGIVQALERHGRAGFVEWCERGYAKLKVWDREYSAWLGVPRSIKLTSVKPSGTVSLLAGATPGVHWEHAPYYLRRVRMAADHALTRMCRDAGYPVEPDAHAATGAVIAFPVAVRRAGRSKSQVSLREKVELAALLQHHWSDNQVSVTADFDPDTEAGELAPLVREYETKLKALSFLPRERHGYAQAPYQTISREEYERLVAKVRPLQGALEHDGELEAKFCDGASCDVL